MILICALLALRAAPSRRSYYSVRVEDVRMRTIRIRIAPDASGSGSLPYPMG
jgi:hypothetical protein